MDALVAIAVGFLIGAWARLLGVPAGPAWMACVAVLGFGLLLSVALRGSSARPAKRALVPLALCAAIAGHAIAPGPRALIDLPPGVLRLVGTVISASHDREASAIVEVDEGRALGTPALVPRGARIRVRGLEAAPGAGVRLIARAPGAVDRFFNPTPHPEWPGARTTDGRARLVGRARIDREPPPWSAIAHALRDRIRRALGATLTEPSSSLACALMLGETGALDREDRDRVRAAGLSHVLAVSGLHVTLLAGVLVWLIARALVRIEPLAARFDTGRLAKAIGVPLTIAYAELIGDQPSAWRAAITTAIGWSLAAAGRRPHALRVTAAAALVCGVLRPDDLARPGFLLSIVATAALVSAPPIEEAGWTKTALALTARTTIATAPAVLWMFGQVPLAGLIANLVIVPVTGVLLMPFTALHTVLALIAPPLAHVTAPIVELACESFLAACEVLGAFPVGQELPPPDIAQGIAVAAGALAVLIAKRWRFRIAALAVLALALGGGELALRWREQPEGILRATFLDVGQGDGALIDLPDGRFMVIDAGGSIGGGIDPGGAVLVPILRARRRDRIDVLVISHPHPDHFGGAAALIDAFEIGELWDTGQAEAEEQGAVTELLARARARGVRIRSAPELCAAGLVRWPCPGFDPGWGPNDNSFVVQLEHAGRRILFTGDVEAHAEHELLERLGPVDVLKVAHHGSRTSSAPELLEILRPAIAIASAGRHNRFDHPHAQVWERLRSTARCAYRTDRDGGVIVTIERDGSIVAEPTLGDRTCHVRPP